MRRAAHAARPHSPARRHARYGVVYLGAAASVRIGLLALLGLVQLAVPCVLSVLCATVLKAPELSLLQLLEVIFGILLAWVGAGEAPDATVLTGGALVIGALVFNEILAWRQNNG